MSNVGRLEGDYKFDGRTIPYTIWVRGEVADVSAILFLGSLQTGELARWVAESCPAGVAVVEGAPHWLASQDGSDIPEFMYAYTEQAYRGVSGSAAHSKLRILAESQAAPGVLRLASDTLCRENTDSITLIQPLGLNAFVYGSANAAARIAVFKHRVLSNLVVQLKLLAGDSRLRKNHP